MKKLVFFMLLFLGLAPRFHHHTFSITIAQKVYADDYGNEDSGCNEYSDYVDPGSPCYCDSTDPSAWCYTGGAAGGSAAAGSYGDGNYGTDVYDSGYGNSYFYGIPEEDFGETECLNCKISDNNFDDYLNYLDSINAQYTDPFPYTVTVNGVEYQGEMTDIYDSDGHFLRGYFSPDSDSTEFPFGYSYSMGGPGTNNTDDPTYGSADADTTEPSAASVGFVDYSGGNTGIANSSSGSSGGGGSSITPVDASVILDPCTGAASAKRVVSSYNVSNAITDERNESNTTVEYGSVITALNTDLNDTPVLSSSPVAQGVVQLYTPPPPTWDSTHGYTLGYSHTHWNNNPPSPADINKLAQVANMLKTNLYRGTPGYSNDDLTYYEKNAIVIAASPSSTYTITINNWTAFLTIANSYSTYTQMAYNNAIDDYYQATHDANQANAQTYALQQIYGDYITISKADYSSSSSTSSIVNTIFQPVVVTGTSIRLKSNCP